MARRKVNKSELIRAAMQAIPGGKPKELADWIQSNHNISVGTGLISNVKSTSKNRKAGSSIARKPGRQAAGNGSVALVKEVADLVKTYGQGPVAEALAVVEEIRS